MAGAVLGSRVPMAEGPAEAQVRVVLMGEALSRALPGEPHGSSALVVVDSRRRHFGAEVCSVFVRMGVRAHLITEDATDRMAGPTQRIRTRCSGSAVIRPGPSDAP